MTTIRDIQQRLDRLAPPVLAESWDNVGLLVGDPAQPVTTIVTGLDVTDGLLDQAAAHRAELVVVHHPVIFTGLKRLVEDNGTTSLVRRLIREGRGLIAAHTNLDSAPAGLNCYVANMLGVRNTRPLVATEARPLLKLVVYVPETHVDAVRAAICAAGAGQIGNYAECTFGAPGTGTFRPGEHTSPFIGTEGRLERVPEVRLETVVPKSSLGRVLEALFAHHPYEEVAYDLFNLENAWPGAGLGCIGTLDAPIMAGTFLDIVRQTLHTETTALVGDRNRHVRTVALCTGSGGAFAKDALRAGADLYLTGEMKYHDMLLTRQWGLPVIVAGHFATERPVVTLLADYLTKQFPALTVVRGEEVDPLG